MPDKTLGQVAYEQIGPPIAPPWELMYEEDQQRWEASAAAVVAAHEARRWREWPPYVDGALPDVVALDDPKRGRKLGFLRDCKWVDEDGVEIIEYGVPPDRWAPIPAPPQEVEHVRAEAEAREASVPTAAEVIAAAERALEAWRSHMQQPVGASGSYGALLESLALAQNSTTEALAAIAKWKEAQRG